MENVSGKARRQFRVIQAAGMPLLTTILVLVVSFARSQETQKHQSTADVAKDKQAAASPTPRDVYRAYLNAVKKNDLAGAKNCWWIPGKDDSALDVLAGMWVASHRLNDAFNKLGLERKQFGDWFAREDCTDAAIDRTLARLDHSKFTVKGDTARTHNPLGQGGWLSQFGFLLR